MGRNRSDNIVSKCFEDGFLSQSLEAQINHCELYELAPLFRKWLPGNQPILEAGCGSGRWVVWFDQNGWKAVGLDWSESLCEQARKYVKNAEFLAGDMRAMPFENGIFGSVVSLGAIEHSPEGPSASLKEYARVLKQGGIAIITVPFLGPVRWVSRLVAEPWTRFKQDPFVRRLFGKSSTSRKNFKSVRKKAIPGWAADFLWYENEYSFYQYNLTKKIMRQLLYDEGFAIQEEFVDFADEGMLHNFGRLAGTFDYAQGKVVMNLFGRLLRKVLPANIMGHMLCYVVIKKNSE